MSQAQKTQKFVSIILVSYNSCEDLAECIPSILNQSYSNYEIILVDNASKDGTVEFVRKNYPNINLIETGQNLGYPGGNNTGFQHAKGDYIVVVNPDTVVDTDWLRELIKPLEEDESITATTSKILLYNQQNQINTCANSTHYTGLAFCRGLGLPAKQYNKTEVVGAVSGCSFAVRKDFLEKIDGFDQDFFLYLEDTDLSWRLRRAGGEIMYIPTSIIYHKFKLTMPSWKYFYIERNRYLMLSKTLDTKLFLLLSPALALTEVITIGHAILNGPQSTRNKTNAYIWLIKNRNIIKNKRSIKITAENISEKDFFRSLDQRIPFEQLISNRWVQWSADILFNSLYRLHYRIVYRLI